MFMIPSMLMALLLAMSACPYARAHLSFPSLTRAAAKPGTCSLAIKFLMATSTESYAGCACAFEMKHKRIREYINDFFILSCTFSVKLQICFELRDTRCETRDRA